MNLRLADERGSLSVFAAILAIAMLVVIGLVADGGRVIAQSGFARDAAGAAARAGVQALDVGAFAGATTGGVQVRQIDPAEARLRVEDMLETGYGLPPEAWTVDTTDTTVSVTVTIVVETTMLGLLGRDQATVSATKTADLNFGGS